MQALKSKNIIAVVILLAIVGGFYAVYRYYVQELLQSYAKNEERLAQLEQKRKQLAMTFQDWRPELVLTAYDRQIEPWKTEVDRYAEFFSLRADDEANRVPEGEVARFWYETTFLERYNALQREAFSAGVAIPQNTFGAEHPSALQGKEVNFLNVGAWLRAFQLGDNATRKLLGANARQIGTVDVWNTQKIQQGTFQLQRYGLSFQMTLADLASFLEDLNKGDLENPVESVRFHSVPGIRLSNRQLMNPTPLLQVSMLMNDLGYIEKPPPARPRDARARMQELGAEGEGRRGRLDRPKRTWWQDFRRKFLPF